MKLPPAPLEEWMRAYYFEAEIDLGSSGVQDYSMRDLRRLLGITCEELDEVVFQDSQSLGGDGLRRALAARWTGGDISRVMATHGSSEANFLLMTALLSRGDEVVVLDPVYPQLRTVAEAIGCALVPWPLRWENGFMPDLDDARRLIGPRTRMVVVNFPHNPTGASLSPAGLDALVSAAAAVGAYLVWDGAFAEITYDGPPLPDPCLRYERAVSMGTFSKCYGLPGLRVGWCLGAADVLEALVRVRDYVTLHLSPLVEQIAERVVDGADRLVAPRRELAHRNRAVVDAWARDHAELVEWVPPRGGVCGFPRLPTVPDVDRFCHALAREEGVLLVPGSCFGHPEHVRLGYGRSTGELEEGLSRLSRLLQATPVFV